MATNLSIDPRLIDEALAVKIQRETHKILKEILEKVLSTNNETAHYSKKLQSYSQNLNAAQEITEIQHIIKYLLVVRLLGVLAVAERQLAYALPPEKGRDLVKQERNQLLELARPMLESIIYEVTGAKVLSMHHDISTVTGEEVVLFALSKVPRFE